MFMRKHTGVDEQRYKWYRDKILFRSLHMSRMEFDGFTPEGNAPIPDRLTGSSWQDGDLAQIASIVKDISVFDDCKLIANKQSAARSGTEQAADLCRVFPLLKRLKKYTVSDLPSDRSPMKSIVKRTFTKLERESKLCLIGNKKMFN